MIKSKIIVLLIIIPTLLWAEEINKQSLVNRFTDSVSNIFGNLTSFDGIKKADLEIDAKDQDFESDIRATIISSFSEENGSFILNQTNISTQDDRETFNTGFIFTNAIGIHLKFPNL